MPDGTPPTQQEPDVLGWLNDIDRALRDIFTTSSDEDEAFDNATRSLDALREYLGVTE